MGGIFYPFCECYEYNWDGTNFEMHWNGSKWQSGIIGVKSTSIEWYLGSNWAMLLNTDGFDLVLPFHSLTNGTDGCGGLKFGIIGNHSANCCDDCMSSSSSSVGSSSSESV